MKRISTIKKLVKAFIENEDVTPLEFKDYKSKEVNHSASVEDMVLRCLRLSELYPSYNTETGKKETRNGARRSSIDIWRHIIFFCPKVTLVQVMKALYNSQDKLYGSYCYDVRRRVFFLRGGYIATGLSGVSLRDELDEYGLTFNDWNIPSVSTDAVPESPF